MSKLKIKDGNEWIELPAGGVGVPAGGSAGDVLVKSSGTNYATEWSRGPIIQYGEEGPRSVISKTNVVVEIEFETLMPDTNYVVLLSHGAQVGGYADVFFNSSNKTTTGFTLTIWSANSSTLSGIVVNWLAIHY